MVEGWKLGARFIKADVRRILHLAKSNTDLTFDEYREMTVGPNGGKLQFPLVSDNFLKAFMKRRNLSSRVPTTEKPELTDDDLAQCNLFVKAVQCATIDCTPHQLIGADETATSPRVLGMETVVPKSLEEVIDVGALHEGNQVTYLPMHNGFGNLIAEAYMRKETAARSASSARILDFKSHKYLTADEEVGEVRVPPNRELTYSTHVPTHYLSLVEPAVEELEVEGVDSNMNGIRDEEEEEKADIEDEAKEPLSGENGRIRHTPIPPQGGNQAKNARGRGRPRKHQPIHGAAVVQLPVSQHGADMKDGENEENQQQQQLQDNTHTAQAMILEQQDQIKTCLSSYSDIPTFIVACNHIRGVISRRLLKFIFWVKSGKGNGDYSTSLVLQERVEWLATYILFIAADQFDTIIQGIRAPRMRATDEEQLQLGLMKRDSSIPYEVIKAKEMEVEIMRFAERRAVQEEMSEEKWINVIDKVVARAEVRKMLQREGERFGEEMKAHIEETYSHKQAKPFIDKLGKHEDLPRKHNLNRYVMGVNGSSYVTGDFVEAFFRYTLLPYQDVLTARDMLTGDKRTKLVLILDRAAAHTTFKIQELCYHHTIDVLYIPGGCTHRVQPLDLGFNSAYKAQLNLRIRTNVLSGEHERTKAKKTPWEDYRNNLLSSSRAVESHVLRASILAMLTQPIKR